MLQELRGCNLSCSVEVQMLQMMVITGNHSDFLASIFQSISLGGSAVFLSNQTGGARSNLLKRRKEYSTIWWCETVFLSCVFFWGQQGRIRKGNRRVSHPTPIIPTLASEAIVALFFELKVGLRFSLFVVRLSE